MLYPDFSKNLRNNIWQLNSRPLLLHPLREMAEWSIAAVLKTVDCNRSGGSNPSLSANLYNTNTINGES